MYKIVEWPGGKALQKLSGPEQRAFWDWFISVKDHRVRTLEEYVCEDRPWMADFEPDSLLALCDWFGKIAESEYSERVGRAIPAEDAATWEGTWLRNRYKPSVKTLSIAFDIAIYLGDVIIRHLPNTRWVHCTRPKRYVHYGQPCIEGLRISPWSPMFVCVGLAGRILARDWSEDALVEIYRSAISE